MDELRQVYDEDLIDPRCIGWDDIESALALGKDAATARLRNEYGLVSDVHKEVSWWYCFHENQHPPVRENLLLREDYPRPEPAIFDPIYRTQPKIGRNDPRACGSGKKFKKCCGK